MSTPQTPIQDSDLPDFVKLALTSHGYQTIEQVLSIPLTDYIELDWLTTEMLDELALYAKNKKK